MGDAGIEKVVLTEEEKRRVDRVLDVGDRSWATVVAGRSVSATAIRHRDGHLTPLPSEYRCRLMDPNTLAEMIAASRKVSIKKEGPSSEVPKVLPPPPAGELVACSSAGKVDSTPSSDSRTSSRAAAEPVARLPFTRSRELSKRSPRREERDVKKRKVPSKGDNVVVDLTAALSAEAGASSVPLPLPPAGSPPASTRVEAFLGRARRLLVDFSPPDTSGASLTNRVLALDRRFLEVAPRIPSPTLDYSQILTRLYFQASMESVSVHADVVTALGRLEEEKKKARAEAATERIKRVEFTDTIRAAEEEKEKL